RFVSGIRVAMVVESSSCWIPRMLPRRIRSWRAFHWASKISWTTNTLRSVHSCRSACSWPIPSARDKGRDSHGGPSMTTAAVPAAIVPPRPAWRSLLWTVPVTVLWTWLIYALPVLPESGLPALAVRLMVHGLIALGLWLGLERTDLTSGQRRTTWLAIMVPFMLWAAVAWTAAINGVFRTGASALPLLPSAIFLPVIIGAPLLLLSKRVGQLLDAMPTTWLVALQLYRVFGSQWLAYWLRGLLPGLWAL